MLNKPYFRSANYHVSCELSSMAAPYEEKPQNIVSKLLCTINNKRILRYRSLNVRFVIGKDGRTHIMSSDGKGRFEKPKGKIERVDWLTKQWVNQKITTFDPNIRKIFVTDRSHRKDIVQYPNL
jgi:hypothetical protein